MFHFSPVPTSLRRVFYVASTAVILACSGFSNAQNLYNATTLPANAQTGVVHFLQQISLAGGPGSYTITGMTFGINWSDLSNDQGLFLDFYTGVNLSPSAADALAAATNVGEVGFLLTAPAAVGNYTYTLTFNQVVPSNVLGVEATLTDDTGGAYATGINGRFSATAPTVGTSSAFVYNDSNLDGTFAGSEQTTFGQGTAYIRMSVTGTAPAPVPEPSTWAMFACGIVALVTTMRLVRTKTSI